MNAQQIQYELQHILSGENPAVYGSAIQAVARHLGSGTPSGSMAERSQPNKPQETEVIIEFANAHRLWVQDIDFNQYVSEGAEQRVYLKDHKTVYKLNDAIYYASWVDYFHNLLLHNYFFTDTAYELVGFYRYENVLYALVKQPFVTATEPTDLMKVKQFMLSNGFINHRNNDYHHPEWNIVLEDLHDENVLTQNGALYFIDTVFYLQSPSHNFIK